MDTRFASHVATMKEKDEKLRLRLDQLQAQLTDLQKERSPGASPKSAYGGSPTGMASPNVPPSYLVIVGGWRDGERKDYIEANLSKLFEAAGVTSQIREVQMFGKRPRCAKISLQFSSDEPFAKRELQQTVISKLREQRWTPRECTKPIWVNQDRSPAQRATSKAVAITGGFLQHTLKIQREQFEIDQWLAARTYLGDFRISGAFPGPVSAPPPRKDEFIVWPVEDHSSGVSVWCDLRHIALALKLDTLEVKKLWDQHLVPQ
eukprot:Skav216052  [mRNA]  locus=scaffold2261:15267:16052:- [translate_table: standard]